jgi:hypothetical protein
MGSGLEEGTMGSGLECKELDFKDLTPIAKSFILKT